MVEELKQTKNLSKPHLKFENVSFSWPSGVKVIENCSFSIPQAGLWMLVGSNGSGKSTIYRLITGLLKPQKGHLESLVKTALVFQNPDHQLLLPSCGTDVLLNISTNLSIKKRIQKMHAALEEVDLHGMESRPIHTLSGGQKQRLALAGALASEAKLLLLDEPTALLDPASQESVLRIIKRLCHRKKDPLTALWITHRLSELDHCDGAARLEKGRIGGFQNGKWMREVLQPLAVRRV